MPSSARKPTVQSCPFFRPLWRHTLRGDVGIAPYDNGRQPLAYIAILPEKRGFEKVFFTSYPFLKNATATAPGPAWVPITLHSRQPSS